MSSDISLHKTSLRGLRETNEDVEKYHLNLANNGKPKDPSFCPIDFLIICDGHGGIDVAEYVVPIAEKIFMKKDLVYPLSDVKIHKIFTSIQNKIIEHPKMIGAQCGCTALIIIRYLDTKYGTQNVQIINLGDCRAVLSRKGLAIPLTKDHKPYWSDEKFRINKMCKNNKSEIHLDENGEWRIGDLSVSRGFGDLDNAPFIGCIPDVFVHPIVPGDEFIIMACDGVFDVLENHDVVNFIRDHINSNIVEMYNIPNRFLANENSRNIATKLGEYAIAKGSTDNISIMIMFFDK